MARDCFTIERLHAQFNRACHNNNVCAKRRPAKRRRIAYWGHEAKRLAQILDVKFYCGNDFAGGVYTPYLPLFTTPPSIPSRYEIRWNSPPSRA